MFLKYLTPLLAIFAVAVLALATSPGAEGQTEKVLYNFSQGSSEIPSAGPVLDQAGNLYGTSSGYYNSEPGAVWELSPTRSGGWKKTNLHVFSGGKDGQNPFAPLVKDAAGNLYGTTLYGGDGQACINLGYAGCGTVFELMPQKGGGWKEKVLYAFQYQPDGAWPVGGLAIDKSGNVYGTTTAGGARCNGNYYKGCGIVFKLTPHSDGTWTETVIHAFGGTDGINPWGTLVIDATGNLFGTTPDGGDLNCNSMIGCGVAFQLMPNADGSWKEKVVHTFINSTDGAAPIAGLTIGSSGSLYGTTNSGGQGGYGTVFELKQTASGWKLNTLFSFQQHDFSENPTAGVILDHAGNLYGTCVGNSVYGDGTAYELERTSHGWNFKLLHAFQERNGDGGFPVDYGTLVMDKKGRIYGTTAGGGKSVYYGTIFQIVP
jgi:hypothetical protein